MLAFAELMSKKINNGVKRSATGRQPWLEQALPTRQPTRQADLIMAATRLAAAATRLAAAAAGLAASLDSPFGQRPYIQEPIGFFGREIAFFYDHGTHGAVGCHGLFGHFRALQVADNRV
jgi:hypothetical protein